MRVRPSFKRKYRVEKAVKESEWGGVRAEEGNTSSRLTNSDIAGLLRGIRLTNILPNRLLPQK